MRPATVLLIDPDPDTQLVCRAMLEHHGMEVITVDTPEAGHRVAIGEQPTVIVTELFVRSAAGWEFVHRLRANPETRGIPIIAFTSCGFAEDRRRAAHAGVELFLVKPTAPTALAEAIARIVRHQSGLARDGDSSDSGWHAP